MLRALRHRLGWRQVDVAEAAGLTQDDVSRGERGRMRDVEKLRRHGRVFDAEIQLSIRWRAGEMDRLLDEGHASIVAWVVGLLGEAWLGGSPRSDVCGPEASAGRSTYWLGTLPAERSWWSRSRPN